jgi:hypothetical protein
MIVSSGDSPRAVPACVRVRSTLLVGSLRALRERGHAERYKANVGAPFYERLLATGAPTWFEIAIAETHYAACDALALPSDEILQIGAAVAPVQVSGIDVVLRAARAGGVTPWTALHNIGRYWARMYDGSGAVVIEKGPKDAHIEIFRQPLARSPYWRTGLRGIIKAVTGALAQKAYVRDLPSQGRDGVSYLVAWA